MDIPALVKTELIELFGKKYGVDEAKLFYSLLYFSYSIPNIILPLIGGSLCD
jgi:hypothetical protein